MTQIEKVKKWSFLFWILTCYAIYEQILIATHKEKILEPKAKIKSRKSWQLFESVP